MNNRMNKKTALALVAGLAMMAASALGGTASSVSGAESILSEGSPLPSHYPQRFDGIGRIDRIDRDEIVIDDTLHGLSGDVRYATPESRHGSSAAFKPGRYVGYMENPRRQITSLWLIK